LIIKKEGILKPPFPLLNFGISRRVLDLDFFSRILDGGSGMDGSSGLWILSKNFQSDFSLTFSFSGLGFWFGFSFGRLDFKERFSIGISSSFGLRIFLVFLSLLTLLCQLQNKNRFALPLTQEQIYPIFLLQFLQFAS
jgi:hypothetical protein